MTCIFSWKEESSKSNGGTVNEAKIKCSLVPYDAKLGWHETRVGYKESSWSPTNISWLFNKAETLSCFVVKIILVKYKKIWIVIVNGSDSIAAIEFSIDLHPAANSFIQCKCSHLRLFFFKIFLRESVIATPCVVNFLRALDKVLDFILFSTIPRFIWVAFSIRLTEEEPYPVFMETFKAFLIIVYA